MEESLIPNGFLNDAAFFWAAPNKAALPPVAEIEIAFAGRSNVGKSSLINALTGRKALARMSHTPGRTQELNFFRSERAGLRLVDMPGYGFAAVQKTKVAAWTSLIHDYLRGRTSLARVFLLIDARHGLKETDRPVLETLNEAAVSFQVVLTKTDELKPQALESRIAETLHSLRKEPAAFPRIVATSSRNGTGIEALHAEILQVLDERAGRR